MIRTPWRLFCTHATILYYIGRHPGTSVLQIADALALTTRTVWGLIGDLKRAGLIEVRKEGRRHHYTLKGDARIPDPLLSHLTAGQLMQALTG